MRFLFGKFGDRFQSSLSPSEENRYIFMAIVIAIVGGALYVLSFYL